MVPIDSRAERAKASIASVIRDYLPPSIHPAFVAALADAIYRQAGRDIYEGWAADMREADR
jgi:hypothetical protein